MTPTFDGGCECGAVRYRMTDRPLSVNCCHCRDCQRIGGSAFALNAMIETVRVEVTTGAPIERRLMREGAGATRAWRCATCETLLYADHPMFGDAMRFVRIGTLDAGERLTPDVHYFVRSKHPWIAIPDGVAAFDTLPERGVGPAMPPEIAARFERAMADQPPR